MSYRSYLSRIGEPKPGFTPPAFPSGFHSSPKSLIAAMKAMTSPQPNQWNETTEDIFFDKDWTEECQGVCNDGEYWYISSNNRILHPSPNWVDYSFPHMGIYKFHLHLVSFFNVDKLGSNHIGDIDYYDGFIYAALENKNQILKIDSNFQSYSLSTLKGPRGGDGWNFPPQSSLPWCAINPWNEYLYSSDYNWVTKIHAYDPQDNFHYINSLKLQTPVPRVQGGCFSDNGHILLASNGTHQFDVFYGKPYIPPSIHCFSALNGHYYGAVKIRINQSWTSREEVEGITIWKSVLSKGIRTSIHLILLDNDLGNGDDDVYFKHYSVPNIEDL